MGFLEVDQEELHLVTESVVNLSHAHGMPAERGSGVAAKDQCHWALSLEAGEPDPIFGPNPFQKKVGRLFSYPRPHLASRHKGLDWDTKFRRESVDARPQGLPKGRSVTGRGLHLLVEVT